MVKRIEKFSLLLEVLKRCLGGHVTSVHHEPRAMRKPVPRGRDSAEGRKTKRNSAALDPKSPETRGHWYAMQVTNHKRLCPFSDNLTTLMFTACN